MLLKLKYLYMLGWSTQVNNVSKLKGLWWRLCRVSFWNARRVSGDDLWDSPHTLYWASTTRHASLYDNNNIVLTSIRAGSQRTGKRCRRIYMYVHYMSNILPQPGERTNGVSPLEMRLCVCRACSPAGHATSSSFTPRPTQINRLGRMDPLFH